MPYFCVSSCRRRSSSRALARFRDMRSLWRSWAACLRSPSNKPMPKWNGRSRGASTGHCGRVSTYSTAGGVGTRGMAGSSTVHSTPARFDLDLRRRLLFLRFFPFLAFRGCVGACAGPLPGGSAGFATRLPVSTLPTGFATRGATVFAGAINVPRGVVITLRVEPREASADRRPDVFVSTTKPPGTLMTSFELAPAPAAVSVGAAIPPPGGFVATLLIFGSCRDKVELNVVGKRGWHVQCCAAALAWLRVCMVLGVNLEVLDPRALHPKAEAHTRVRRRTRSNLGRGCQRRV